MFFQPPAKLFDSAAYQDTGVALFLDRTITRVYGTSLDWVHSLVGPGSAYLQTSR